MQRDQFLKSVKELFEITPDSELNRKCKFKELEEWDSLLALEIIAKLDEEYDVELDGDDIRTANTLDDLFELAKAKSGHGG